MSFAVFGQCDEVACFIEDSKVIDELIVCYSTLTDGEADDRFRRWDIFIEVCGLDEWLVSGILRKTA